MLVVLLWVLPSVGIAVPPFAVATAAALLAATSVVLTRLNLRAVGLKPSRSPDVGVYGMAVRTLDPRGYVRVGNELWPALSERGSVVSGTLVVVVRMEGFRLVVQPADEPLPSR